MSYTKIPEYRRQTHQVQNLSLQAFFLDDVWVALLRVNQINANAIRKQYPHLSCTAKEPGVCLCGCPSNVFPVIHRICQSVSDAHVHPIV
jgi:hypothetical protein